MGRWTRGKEQKIVISSCFLWPFQEALFHATRPFPPSFLKLSCTLEREFRCMELAELMTPNATGLAIKYASRSRRLILAQRLSELAAERAAELAAAVEPATDQEPDSRHQIHNRYQASSQGVQE